MNGVDLSPMTFFLQAGSVGRGVMIILLLASIWCWLLIIEGVISAMRLKSALRSWRGGNVPPMLAPISDAARAAQAVRLPGEGIGETRQRVMEAMNRAGRGVIGRVEGGLANLAVISSVAPFVGLFGTVWGIMTSFTAIAASKDTSLAVVAPGIAEALATTAIGLAAAIPASIGYTRIGASLGSAAQDLAGMIEEEAVRAVSTLPVTRHANVKEPSLKEVV